MPRTQIDANILQGADLRAGQRKWQTGKGAIRQAVKINDTCRRVLAMLLSAFQGQLMRQGFIIGQALADFSISGQIEFALGGMRILKCLIKSWPDVFIY